MPLITQLLAFFSDNEQEEMCPSEEEKERRPSEQDMAESAMQFLERRRSSDQGIGAIQPDLYRRRGSVLRHESATGRPSVARVQLQISYDFSRSDFHITILEVCDVIRLDEYHVAVSLSDSNFRRETNKIISGAPFHKEEFKFALGYQELLEKNLTVQLVGAPKINIAGMSPQVMGSVSVDLSTIDPSDDLLLWTNIEMQETKDSNGELFVGLQYLPTAERLVVNIHQAKDLACKDALPNAYAKVFLLQEGKVVKKRKSGVRKNSQSPVWKEALQFSITPNSLASCQLEIDIVDYDRIGNNKLLGQIMFGGASREKMWREVLSGKTVNPKWIPLTFLT